ncbi:Gfo/Idh/MocA family oxidoreductase [Flavisolibacter ginsenosidimutans]|uniref:Oxidoreductase n=1 Tax=Flavisolibacter ginsenosidimutans TaxID=661481 RepID=A0A5B8UN70_9BACT|nr:Gfo/Idh/MocA family oxidoreductase [Flavisolibacter ginsenosidimutans]QEC58028.1 oxidoreductase [Flavisolibacter ginsenosidimutans]
MKPIRTALLSYGMSGRLFHAPFLHVNPGFNFYAVWERSKNLAEEKYPGIKTCRTIEELLRDDEVELVIVNTPNYTHFDYAKKALQGGKHVVVEKPFVVTVKEGEELIALAKEKGKVLSVYQNRRYDSDYRALKKVISEGWLGEIVEAEFHFDRYNENLSPKVHKETPGPGTGALYDLGSHIVDQALQLFGMPQAVFGDIRTVRPVSEVDDYFEVLLYYPSLRVRLHSSYLVREALPGYILHGSKGSFLKSKTNVQEEALNESKLPVGDDWGLEPDSERGFLHTEKDGQIIKEYIASPKGAYNDYFTELYKAIREGEPAPVSAEDGLNVVRIIEAAFESSRQKRVIGLK